MDGRKSDDIMGEGEMILEQSPIKEIKANTILFHEEDCLELED